MAGSVSAGSHKWKTGRIRRVNVSTAAGAGLWAIVLLGAILRFFPISFGQSYVNARPDEEVAVLKALGILAGDPNPHFFHWPSLTLYGFAGLFAGASWIRQAFGFETSLSNAGYMLVARGFIALAGTVTIVVLFGMARQIAGRSTGVIAALFLSVALLHVRDSHFAMTDVLMTLLVTMSLTLLVRATTALTESAPDDRSVLRTFGAAGLIGGLAASTKYSAAAIVAAMAAAQAVALVKSRRLVSLTTFVPSIVFIGAFGFGFLVGTPYALLDYASFEAGVQFTVTHLSDGHGVNLGSGWSYHLTHSLPYGVGIPTFVASTIGIVPFVRHYRPASIIVGAFAVALYVSLGSGRTVFFRYTMPIVPVVCLLAAVAVTYASATLAGRMRISVPVAAATMAALLAAPSLVGSVWFDVLLARTDTRVLAARWLTAHLRPDHSLHDAGGSHTRLDLRTVRFHEWTFDRRTRSFGHAGGETPDWLVLHDSPLRLYAAIPPELRQLAAERYTLAAAFPATRGRARSAVYDHQDAFFMPFSGFRTIVRPGPTIWIYRLDTSVSREQRK